ncbi:hypothetical protein BJ742DRAFT_735058 [Cladochytrium replicatum]|nr:hypothetical protein BJ742DRAFT_735058 [Cladochytrium replicatum]
MTLPPSTVVHDVRTRRKEHNCQSPLRKSSSELCALSDLSEDEYNERLKSIQATQRLHSKYILHCLKIEKIWFYMDGLSLSSMFSHFTDLQSPETTYMCDLSCSNPEGIVTKAEPIGSFYPRGAILHLSTCNRTISQIAGASGWNVLSITKAINLVNKGSRLIGTNPDVNGPTENGIAPATGAFVSAIECATGFVQINNHTIPPSLKNAGKKAFY